MDARLTTDVPSTKTKAPSRMPMASSTLDGMIASEWFLAAIDALRAFDETEDK